MSLIRRNPEKNWTNPFFELERLQNEMNRLFDFSLSRWPERDMGILEGAWSPAIDIYDSRDNIVVKADIPGLSKDEIEVSVHNDTLVIRGEKKREDKIKEDEFVRTERFYGGFHRAVTLPSTVDADKVKAVYNNGVLELTLPKREEVKPKQIQIDVK